MKTKKVTKASPKTSSTSKVSKTFESAMKDTKHAADIRKGMVHDGNPPYRRTPRPIVFIPNEPEKKSEPLLKLSRYNESPPGGWVWPGTDIKATTWKDLKLAVRNATGLSDEDIEHFVAKSLPEDWRTPA